VYKLVNIRKLRGKMVECDISIEGLASKIGIDRATLYRRLERNGKDFSISEVDTIVHVLNLSADEANAIFFSQFVACNANIHVK